MRIGVYDPYLDTLGGGERYMLTLASALSTEHTVSLFWGNDEILQAAGEKFGLPLGNVWVYQNIFSSSYSKLRRIRQMRRFDLLFFLSDGSVPLLLAKKNILLFQFPLPWRKSLTLYDHMKLQFVSRIIYNSEFVMQSNSKLFKMPSEVLYPPVSPVPTSTRKKEKLILGVGRFTKGMNMKKQDFLITTFKSLSRNLRDWELILIGSVLDSDMDFLEKLKVMAKGCRVKIILNPPHKTLVAYLERASIFWHAAGFGEDLSVYPERAEHFGIATVEAMSAGCVPVVFNGGGLREIVDDGVNGFLYTSADQLESRTTELTADAALWRTLSKKAIDKAADFSPERFRKRLMTFL
ncbi:MAG: glycosyltransferase family 4 protein [bacterium]|nr:glycosyltransferase family 4 protein [bacterium]